MNTLNAKAASADAFKNKKEQMGRNAVKTFLNSIQEIGYEKKQIITIVQEELK